MPEVISNSSPIQYLFQTRLLHLLPSLYGRVLIPEAVAEELERGRATGVNLPVVGDLTWVKVERPRKVVQFPLAAGLGLGESAVIALAGEVSDPLALLDDLRARRLAKTRNIPVTGTLGVLLKAKQVGKVGKVLPVIEELESLEFRLHATTKQAVLRLAGET